ncbi:unnamed protein product [Protopolystoma xenopodis]|uniref:Uncharacterized protein n=1 Tax=Protopolystoma xenopodis TaxID=117903 RepID=A0A3S5BB81_9PLAT|nr:unnamed protein product [Protopolystoma xenopodis]
MAKLTVDADYDAGETLIVTCEKAPIRRNTLFCEAEEDMETVSVPDRLFAPLSAYSVLSDAPFPLTLPPSPSPHNHPDYSHGDACISEADCTKVADCQNVQPLQPFTRSMDLPPPWQLSWHYLPILDLIAQGLPRLAGSINPFASPLVDILLQLSRQVSCHWSIGLH